MLMRHAELDEVGTQPLPAPDRPRATGSFSAWQDRGTPPVALSM